MRKNVIASPTAAASAASAAAAAAAAQLYTSFSERQHVYYTLTNGSRRHVRDEAREELLPRQVLVVLLHVIPPGRCELHGDQLVSLLLESLDNFADESTLDAVGLDHDVGAFHGCGGGLLCGQAMSLENENVIH